MWNGNNRKCTHVLKCEGYRPFADVASISLAEKRGTNKKTIVRPFEHSWPSLESGTSFMYISYFRPCPFASKLHTFIHPNSAQVCKGDLCTSICAKKALYYSYFLYPILSIHKKEVHTFISFIPPRFYRFILYKCVTNISDFPFNISLYYKRLPVICFLLYIYVN